MVAQTRKKEGRETIQDEFQYADSNYGHINVTGQSREIKPDGSSKTSDINASYHQDTGFSSARGRQVMPIMASYY